MSEGGIPTIIINEPVIKEAGYDTCGIISQLTAESIHQSPPAHPVHQQLTLPTLEHRGKLGGRRLAWDQHHVYDSTSSGYKTVFREKEEEDEEEDEDRVSDTYSNIATPLPPRHAKRRSMKIPVKMTSNLPECWFRFLIMSSFLVVYMCIGAGVFCVIEREYERSQIEKLKTMWSDFQQEHSVPSELMDKFLAQHYEACEMGDTDHDHNNVQWDYISSLFFTGTILTTIGYGHSSPSTSGGRIFTIFYAVAGIPFMLGLLNVVAEILLTTLKALKSRIKKKPCADVFHHEVFLSSLCWVILLLIIMTLIFKAQESTWSYEQSIYFSFITMTTIGFGDLVPAQENVVNNSPKLIVREFFNMVLIFISVLIWYFLSQVSAQVLKVRLKKLYNRWTERRAGSDKCFIRDPLAPSIPNTQHDGGGGGGDSEQPLDRCSCPCTCGYNDRLDYSVSASSGVYSNFADNISAPSEARVGGEICDQLGLCNLESIAQERTTEECSSSSSSSSPELLDIVPSAVHTVMKIPSIIITPVTSLSSPPEPLEKQQACNYDSGKGSSEITINSAVPCVNNVASVDHSSSGSLSSIISNFSAGRESPGSCMNGGTPGSMKRMQRSRSADLRDPDDPVYVDLKGAGYNLRNAKSMHELGGSCNSCSPHRTPSSLRRNDLSRSVQSFSIHTQLFDDMMSP